MPAGFAVSCKRLRSGCVYRAGFSYDGLEYTGTLPISRPASLIIAMRRSGSSSGLSSETPMASTVALMIASASSSQTKPVASKSLWPSLIKNSSEAFDNL